MPAFSPADLVRQITRSPLFYALSSRPLMTVSHLSRHVEHQRNLRDSKEHDDRSARLAACISPDGVVLSGLFAGLRYPDFTAFGSSLPPKLLGTYEAELHPALRQLRKHYDLIIDVGCAEGYYAVGLALVYPNTPVHAYDINAKARAFASGMAKLNGVASDVHLHELASQQTFHACQNKSALIIVDCEGFERFLFSHENIAYLELSDLIIELHPKPYPDLVQYLHSLFQASHECSFVDSISDAEKSTAAAVLAQLSEQDKRFSVSEFRPGPQQWLVCKSKAFTAG
jgi:hypothetical protein